MCVFVFIVRVARREATITRRVYLKRKKMKRAATTEQLKAALAVSKINGFAYLYDEWEENGVDDDDLLALTHGIKKHRNEVINADMHLRHIHVEVPKLRKSGFSAIHFAVCNYKPQGSSGIEYANCMLLACSEYFHISVDRIQSKLRNREYVYARQMFCYLVRGKIFLRETGRMIGNRDHTTVLHSIAAIENKLCDPAVKKQTEIDIERLKLMV